MRIGCSRRLAEGTSPASCDYRCHGKVAALRAILICFENLFGRDLIPVQALSALGRAHCFDSSNSSLPAMPPRARPVPMRTCGGIDASSKRPWPWSGRRGARLGEPGGPWICGKKRAPRLHHECLRAAAVIPLISHGRMRKLCGLPLQVPLAA
jgi:hypothetical protein